MKNKHLIVSGIAVLLICVGLSGCTEQNDTENPYNEQYTENEIFGLMMNNKIGTATIWELMDATVDLWKEQGRNAYTYGEYAKHVSGDIWDVGVFINTDGDIYNYSWEYNFVTNEENALSDSAKMLYDESWYENFENAKPDIPKPEIININSYSRPTRLYIFGIVKNVASVSIEFLKLTATLYDSNNNITATDWIYATPTIIASGEKACFDILFSGISSNYRYDVKVDSFINHGLIPYEDIEVYDLSDELTSLGYEITGYVENLGSSAIDFMTLRGAAYDASGQIIDFSYALFPENNSLYAGQIREFNIIFYRWNIDPESIADYEIFVDNMIV